MSGQLNALDLLFVIILAVSLLAGIFRGLTRELLSLLFLVAALALAFCYYEQAGLLLGGFIKGRGLADFAGFVLILIFVLVVGALATHFIGKHLLKGPLKTIDRFLGALFGILRGILLSGLAIYCFLVFPLNRKMLNRSLLAPVLAKAITTGIQVLPPALREKLKVIRIHDRQEDNRNSRTV